MTSIEDVLEKYLCGDLRALCATPVGYPILSTAFAGVELLGALLSPTRFRSGNGLEYFSDYWVRHLYPGENSLARAKAVYELARHGVAHQFFVKGEIGIMSRHRGKHLTHDGTRLWIDTHALAEDVISSYEGAVQPLLGNPTDQLPIEARFKQIIAAGKANSLSLDLGDIFDATPRVRRQRSPPRS